QNAKALSQAPKPSGKAALAASQQTPAASATPAAGTGNSGTTTKHAVRTVGPPFMSSSQTQTHN
ncbi:MAG TPA: hypothetical protein VGH13_17500, partial [Xanthobacteraceae bacterium]